MDGASDLPLAVVIGGTGFLGRRVVSALLAEGARVRIAARHPSASDNPRVETAKADIRDPAALREALAGADAAVNAVSLYRQSGSATFHAVHVKGAKEVAQAARDTGARLVHVSGLGADPDSPQRYIRARGEGELAVRAAHPEARIIRPSAMFGPDDALLSGIRSLLRRAPVYPLFGRGETRLQPVHAEDAGLGAARLALAAGAAPLHDFAGPEILTYRALVETVARAEGVHPRLLPMPFAAWRLLAEIAERLPGAPLTTDQVALMRGDNIADPAHPGLPALGVRPRSVSDALAQSA